MFYNSTGVILVCLLIAHIFLSSVLSMIGLIFVFLPTYVDNVTLYWSNTTAVVANSTTALQVVQDASYPGDFKHRIELYKMYTTCSDLPTFTETEIQTGNDFSSINFTTAYATAGSSITFNICGFMNSTTAHPLERLELMIVKGLEDLEYTEAILRNFYKCLYFLPGIGEWSCKEVTVYTDDHDYYTVIFLPLPKIAVFKYSVTYAVKSIDLVRAPIDETYTLYKDQEKWEFPGTKLFDFSFKSCVVAKIVDSADTPVRKIHIRTHSIDPGYYDLYEGGQVVILVGLLYFLTGIVVLLTTYTWCVCTRRKSVAFD